MREKIYNAADYGILPGQEDNSAAFQKLMNQVNQAGGGTIFFPVGTYRFAAQTWALSYVNIVGESRTQTVLKMTGRVTEETGPIALLYHHYPDNREAILNDPVVGCTYSNFTVDATEMICDRYRTGNKAFYFQNCIECTWRDLTLIGTPATALGVDCLVDCLITGIKCKDCGRVWTPDIRFGGAAIGIGAGLYDEENVIVSDCIVEGAGHFGIFFEHQALFNPAVYQAQPRGVLITNNIVRAGRNHGIGARGMSNVKISSNLIYGNRNCGIYVDNQAMNIDISDNTILDSGEAGVCLNAAVHADYSGTTGDLDNVWIRNNLIKGTGEAIRLRKAPGKEIRGLLETGNVTIA